MSFRKVRIGETIKIEKLEKILYSNVDVVILEALPKESKINGSLIDGFVRVFNGIMQLTEINDTDIDIAENVNKFCVGSDGKIKLIVEKDKYINIDSAKRELNGYLIYYDIQPVEIIEDKFILDVFDRGTDERLYPSRVLSSEEIKEFKIAYCRNLSLERGNEPYFIETPATQIKEIK